MTAIDDILSQVEPNHIITLALIYFAARTISQTIDKWLKLQETKKKDEPTLPLNEYLKGIKAFSDTLSGSISSIFVYGLNTIRNMVGLPNDYTSAETLTKEMEDALNLEPSTATIPGTESGPKMPDMSSGVVEEMVLSTQSELFTKLEGTITRMETIIDKMESFEDRIEHLERVVLGVNPDSVQTIDVKSRLEDMDNAEASQE